MPEIPFMATGSEQSQGRFGDPKVIAKNGRRKNNE
jgi:hypothetical protein